MPRISDTSTTPPKHRHHSPFFLSTFPLLYIELCLFAMLRFSMECCTIPSPAVAAPNSFELTFALPPRVHFPPQSREILIFLQLRAASEQSKKTSSQLIHSKIFNNHFFSLFNYIYMTNILLLVLFQAKNPTSAKCVARLSPRAAISLHTRENTRALNLSPVTSAVELSRGKLIFVGIARPSTPKSAPRRIGPPPSAPSLRAIFPPPIKPSFSKTMLGFCCNYYKYFYPPTFSFLTAKKPNRTTKKNT